MCFSSAKSSQSQETRQSDERQTSGDNSVLVRNAETVINENLSDEIASEALEFLALAENNTSQFASDSLNIITNFALEAVQATQDNLKDTLSQTQGFSNDVIQGFAREVIENQNNNDSDRIENVIKWALVITGGALVTYFVFGGKK